MSPPCNSARFVLVIEKPSPPLCRTTKIVVFFIFALLVYYLCSVKFMFICMLLLAGLTVALSIALHFALLKESI